jgi:hypothetical protein
MAVERAAIAIIVLKLVMDSSVGSDAEPTGVADERSGFHA